MSSGVAGLRQAIDQPDRTVVPDGETVREIAYRGGAVGMPLDGQKGLMLLRGKAEFQCALFAEDEKLPQEAAKFRKETIVLRLEPNPVNGAPRDHDIPPKLQGLHYVVSRHNTRRQSNPRPDFPVSQ
jgi:hypothetical protein